MSEPMRRLRVGVIGVGLQGTVHLNDLKANPRAHIAAICDLNEELLRAQAERFSVPVALTDYQQLLAREDIEAVVVAVPDHLHRDPAVAALEAGKHLLLEKPMALTVPDAEAIASAAEASTKQFMLHMSNRWMPAFAKGREAITSGQLGEVRYVFSRMSNRIEIPTQRLPWLRHSHLAYWIGVHRLDIARWWIGREAVRVRAVQRKGVLAEMGLDTADFYQATVEFDGGAVLNMEGSWILPAAHPGLVDSKFYALCDNGVIDIDRLRSELMLSRPQGFEMSTPGCGQFLDQWGGFTTEASRHFVQCALSNRRPMITADDGLALTRTLCAIVESCQADGKVVELTW